GAIQPIELTTEDIRNTKAYKEYYACATGAAAPKPKASARKKKGGSASSITPPTLIATLTSTTTVVAAPRLSVAAKGKQPARATSPTDPLDVKRTEAEQLKIILRRRRHETHISQQGGSSTDEGTGSIPGVLDVPSDESKEEDDQDEAEKVNDDDDDEEDISKTDEQEATESGGNDEEAESYGESEEEETTEKEEESFDPIPRTPEESEDDGNDRVKSLEVNFSNIPSIVHQYMHQQMPEAVREAVQTQTDRLQDSVQRENDEFLKTIDENMKKIIKEQ
nr:hypothetical protein [Tanacetum cinerariifolium]